MPWISIAITPGATVGVEGQLQWFRPDATSAADAHLVPAPTGMNVVGEKSTWATDGVSALNTNGYTVNALLTKHWQLWPLGMRAPDNVPDVVLAAGPGITSEVICYLRGFDAKTDEVSPLSAPSLTLSAANQSITYQNLGSVDVSNQPRWTHLEGWESRDGGLPRFVWRRQIGVTTVTHAKSLGELGEAETTTWTKPPRCRYGVVWHGRYVLAGNDQNPTTIYLMEIGFPERWAGLTLSTKTRQPIVGLKEINGRLLIFCPFATEVVSGWTEDDLRIDIQQPAIGCLSHHGLVETDGYLWIPTQEQPYLTDGSSWFPMGGDMRLVWAEDCKNNRAAYESMYADHLPDEHVVRFYVREATSDILSIASAQNTFWVADYETTLPSEGGSMGQPRWSYDVYGESRSCAALMALPRGRRRDALQGSSFNGAVFMDSVGTAHGWDEASVGNVADPGENYSKIVELVTGALQFDNIGGPPDHSIKLQEATVIMRSELTAWTFQIFSGDVECFLVPNVTADDNGYLPAFQKTVPASLIPPTITASTQPEWTHYFGSLPKVAGRAFTVRILATNPEDIRIGGLALLHELGLSTRQPGRVPAE